MSCSSPTAKEIVEMERLRDLLLQDEQEESRPPKEAVDHPAHYNQFRYETIDVIEDWKLGFNLGNALKYLSRCDAKGKPLEDLAKAVWYIQREIALRQK